MRNTSKIIGAVYGLAMIVAGHAYGLAATVIGLAIAVALLLLARAIRRDRARSDHDARIADAPAWPDRETYDPTAAAYPPDAREFTISAKRAPGLPPDPLDGQPLSALGITADEIRTLSDHDLAERLRAARDAIEKRPVIERRNAT